MLRDLFRTLRDALPGKGDPWRGFGGSGANRLRWWVCFSGALHLVLILTLLVVPASTARRELPIPVYTVDLVAGSMPAPRPEPPSPKRQEAKPAPVEPLPPLDEDPLDEVAVEPAVPDPPKTVEAPKKVPPPKIKEQVKKPPKKAPPPKKVKKAAEKPKKKVVKRKKPAKPKKVVKRKKPVRKSPKKLVKKTPRAPKRKGKDPQLVRRLKDRRIGDALATAKERARLQREARANQSAAGSGTAVGGLGGGGGIVRAMEFVIYRNEMLDRIKERWTWIGRRTDLEVTVGFGVNAGGEIFGLKLLKSSGDRSYDESVVRAVRSASPLPRPPARYAREFAEVELIFRPESADG